MLSNTSTAPLRVRVTLAALTLSVGWLVGCSSGGGAGPGDAGALDGASADGTVPDAGTDTGAVDAGSDAADSGPQCLGSGATTDSCRSCCAAGFPQGSAIFDQFTLECACSGQFCGPSEAGAADAAADSGPFDGGDDSGLADGADGDDAALPEAGTGVDAGGQAEAGAGDGGLYGTDPCEATCTQHVQPNAVCNTCILSTLGSVADPGMCGVPVLMQCLNDATCYQYFGCIQNCPP